MATDENGAAANRRGGLPILKVNGTMLCVGFMRGRCPASECPRLHLPKSERPPCPNFARCGACKFGLDCWYPHQPRGDSGGEIGEGANLGVQVHKTHLTRFEAFLATQPDVATCGRAQLPIGRKADHLTLLLHAADPVAFGKNERFRTALARIYLLTHRDVDVHRAVHAAVAPHAPVAGKTFRLQTFPKALERQLGDGPASVCACCSLVEAFPHKLALAAKGHSHVLSVVLADEVFHAGVAPRDAAPAVAWDATAVPGTPAPALCKAYFKLREALANSWIADALGPDSVALDVGASPGGWSQCLIEHGCARVVAVDPGDVAPLPRVEHLRMKVQDAVPLLAARGEQADALVCDVNCSPSEAAAMLRACRPVLRAGAPVMLTFKKFSGEGKCTSTSYRSDQAAAMASLEELCGSSGTVVHLFANTAEERTYIARLLPDPSRAP